MSRASAMVCKRHSEGSLRPLQNCLMDWGDMPTCFANSTQLMFFPSLLFADSTATHTFLFSLCLFLKIVYTNSLTTIIGSEAAVSPPKFLAKPSEEGLGVV